MTPSAERSRYFGMKRRFVYIMASRSRELYVGQTPNLQRRMDQHRRAWSGYVARHDTRRLVYWEFIGPPEAAIAREKQIKKWTRMKKIALIESKNPTWKNLSP